jgi:broad specificity phosphatase PhoE
MTNLSTSYFQHTLDIVNPWAWRGGIRKNSVQLVQALLPLIALHPRAAKPLTRAVSGWNAIASIAFSPQRSVLKSLRSTVEFVATFFHMRSALILHTMFNIVEDGISLKEVINRGGPIEAALIYNWKIVGDVCYLSTFIKTDKKMAFKFKCISLVVQGVINSIKVMMYIYQQTKREDQIVGIRNRFNQGGVNALKFSDPFDPLEISKIEVLDAFIKCLMCFYYLSEAADAHDQTLTKKGFAVMSAAECNEQMALFARKNIEKLAHEADAEIIRIVHSSSLKAKQTAERIAGDNCREIVEDSRLDDSRTLMFESLGRENSPLSQQLRKLPTDSTDRTFWTKTFKVLEAFNDISQRLKCAVRDHLNAVDERTFTVFITHRANIEEWFRELHDHIPRSWKDVTDATIFPMQQIEGVFSKFMALIRPSA